MTECPFKIVLCIAVLLSTVPAVGADLKNDLGGDVGKEYLLSAKRRFNEVRSYRCKATNVVMKYGLIKNTRYFNRVKYSFEKPNKIRMTWTDPFLLRGQIAVFRDNELRVKLKFMPFAIRMDPNGLLAQDPAGNRIDDTDLGHLLDQLLAAITPETRVAVADPIRHTTTEDTIPIVIENKEGRVLVALDKKLTLPISIEYYGSDGRLLEACYFEDLTLDVKFSPDEFELLLGV